MHETVPVVWYCNLAAPENSKIQRKMTMIRTHGQASFVLMRCENVKNPMRCENANAMPKSEKDRIAFFL
jgi:hypothetical protein